MIGFVTWPPYGTKIKMMMMMVHTLLMMMMVHHLIKDDGTKRWPSDKANHSCENAL